MDFFHVKASGNQRLQRLDALLSSQQSISKDRISLGSKFSALTFEAHRIPRENGLVCPAPNLLRGVGARSPPEAI